MLSSIYYGNIKSDKFESWKENKDPYDILEHNNRANLLSGWEFLALADKLFSDKIQVDWGSFDYMCSIEQLEKLMAQTKCEMDLSLVNGNERIGIIFIEES